MTDLIPYSIEYLTQQLIITNKILFLIFIIMVIISITAIASLITYVVFHKKKNKKS
ncbi:hypothetical protein [Anaerocolumna aminovalerica]|uniref:hypothetical protein n=1 Tax=Anaerocolumna aminovalerica TaxID=1527 RepID=UPI001C0EB1BE|nr:hypothetical protein [Anaerocolumna aminovalerica]MBU5332400.1 hypothetical protein [Anaerocolumna aminovalerica]